MMHRVSSKSQIVTKKGKASVVGESKKGSRVLKSNSVIKITSQGTEQNSGYTLGNTLGSSGQIAKGQLQSLSQKLIARMPNTMHLIDRPSTYMRQSARNTVAKTSVETVPQDPNCEELKKAKHSNE
jgi:hypothetical protein